MECSEKLKNLPPYIFARIKKLKDEVRLCGTDVIDLDMGNPDKPTPSHIVERLCDTVRNHPDTHRYPQAKGMPKLRKVISEWYKERFNVDLDPDKQVLVLVGSKEGICHLAMAYLNPGDIALVPDPTYPVHFNGVYLAGGEVYSMPLLEKNNYIPKIGAIPDEVSKKAKILFICYPHNPTTAVVEDTNFFSEVVEFAKKYNLIVVHDFAYSEIVFDGYDAPSFLQTPGAIDVGVEFHSFSKTYNMAGWRIGFVVGNSSIISNLEKFKSFVDYGVSTAIQLCGVSALTGPQDCVDEIRQVYQKRRNIMVEGMAKLGWEIKKPKATMYLWAPLPQKYRHMSSMQFCEFLLRETGIAISPGSGFGKYGEGYLRIALVTHNNRFHDALLRFKKILQ
ncbi:LL-diaminopimelate aminotransferase [Candidatus Desantisbacteria bacterium CG07_land_8_20_14_0_80_39_15]|uniref:Aminotransferase n=2 Tax=unclassified Candidatus Desantisiibacteriota TaxID=3106372 RepID=A0A2H9PAM5_9BACT|nr:MAG: LL-diaminopimelate aminotransferase [Candidatus Desantisbacteria bacterium CG07_land_8_20_14_0_80_39_15]PIZ14770.1 MAG: LL-diaminopimelate aminotransferase [Candidatus Desantisbacteria bacterium CG_4_10_14_0_8_um_filter_39_17]